MFIAIKTDDGRIKGKISFYCRALHVSRQAFNKYLKTKATPWKYQPLADAMVAICREDECNDIWKDPYVSGVTAQTAGRSRNSW